MRFAAPFLSLLVGCAHPGPTSRTADDSGALVVADRRANVEKEIRKLKGQT
jgi:hypothetical protein